MDYARNLGCWAKGLVFKLGFAIILERGGFSLQILSGSPGVYYMLYSDLGLQLPVFRAIMHVLDNFWYIPFPFLFLFCSAPSSFCSSYSFCYPFPVLSIFSLPSHLPRLSRLAGLQHIWNQAPTLTENPSMPSTTSFTFFVSLVPFILPSPISTSSPLPDPSSCSNPFSTSFRLRFLCLIWFGRTREDIKLPVSGRLIIHAFDRDIPCSPIVLWPGIPSFRDTRCLSRTFGVVVCFQHPYGPTSTYFVQLLLNKSVTMWA